MSSVLLVMSFMGSTLLVLFWFLGIVFKDWFTSAWRYRLLRINLLYFLLPVPFFREEIWQLWHGVVGPVPFAERNMGIIDLNHAVQVSFAGEKRFPDIYAYFLMIMALWAIFMLFMLFRQIARYHRLSKGLFQHSEKINDPKMETCFKKQKQALRVIGPVEIRTSELVDTPMTAGFWVPVIFLPEGKISPEEAAFVFRHELMHIKHHDYLFKLLGMAVIAVHWFNPLVYFLFRELAEVGEHACDEAVGEHACDEAVVMDFNRQERVLYGSLILDLSANQVQAEQFRLTPVSYFANDEKKRMKERLRKMKEVKPRTKRKMAFSMAMMAGILMMHSVTVFAYRPPVVVHMEEGEFTAPEEGAVDVDAYFVSQDKIAESEDPTADLDFSMLGEGYTGYFIDENGTAFPVCVGNQNLKTVCAHSYQDGQYVEHTKYSDGSCKKVYYNAKICSKCHDTLRKEKIKTVTYTKCTH